MTKSATELERELEETKRELKEVKRALVQSEKMASLGQLVTGVAHEINTPVGSIHSGSDLMMRALKKLRRILDGAPGELQQSEELTRTVQALEDVGEVNRTACERIVSLVRSLRIFARKDDPERTKVDIHNGLDTTLVLVHHKLKNRIDVIRNYGEIPAVDGFPNQLNQVFMNVLVNAAQAIEEKGSIRVETRREGDHVHIGISDTGTGIAPENLDKIFEPGFTTKGVGKGTGLGLAICAKIIRAHGGTIEAQSERGRGTTFTISLPVSAPEPAEKG